MWADFLICLFLGFFGVHKFRERKIGTGILYLCTFGLFGIGWVVDSIRYLMVALRGETHSVQLGGDNILLPDGTLPIVISSSLMLQPGETCHYSKPASSIVTKNKVVGYSGGSSGVSIRVVKGMSYRIGASKGAPVRQDIQETYPGTLTITNKRIVFSAPKGSYDKKLSSLSSIVPYKNGLDFQFGSQNYSMSTKDSEKIFQIISHIVNTNSE